MLEVTLGVIAAALISKALDRAGDRAVDGGEGVLRRLVAMVRGRLSDGGDPEGSKALERVEDAPDSKSRIEALAAALDEEAEDPEFRRALSEYIEEAKGAGVDVESAVQIAFGSQSVQVTNARDNKFEINYGSDGGDRPRRISD